MFRVTTQTVVAVLIAATMLTTALTANENVYQTTLQSTAWIVASEGTGSGVLVDRDERLVITNYHVTEDDPSVHVFFPVIRGNRAVAERDYYVSGRSELGIQAEVVARDKSRDIAILKLASLPDHVVAIEMGDACMPGQTVHSIGNPGASQALWNYTFGKVRQNYYRRMKFDFGWTQMQMLETTAPVNQGDSGGPIVDDQGKLVGLTQSFATKSRMYSYGVDISEIRWFLKKYRQSQTEDPSLTLDLNDSTTSGSGDVEIVRGNFRDLELLTPAGDR